MIRPQATVFEAIDILLVSAHRLESENPQNRQVGIDDDAEPYPGKVVEIGGSNFLKQRVVAGPEQCELDVLLGVFALRA